MPAHFRPVPYRCMWCRASPPGVEFDASHVLPKCLGNDDQQTLPPGIVCKPCNNYFGTKIEPALLRDPALHVIAVVVGLVDPNDNERFRNAVFDDEHPSTRPVNRNATVAVTFAGSRATFEVKYAIDGQIEREYSTRDMAKISRAIHKVAFESLAWYVHVQGSTHVDLSDPMFDLFDARFDAVREWAKGGQPHGRVRPIARRGPERICTNWTPQLFEHNGELIVELDLFGDCYAVSLTSPTPEVAAHLQAWCPWPAERSLLVQEEFVRMEDLRVAGSPREAGLRDGWVEC